MDGFSVFLGIVCTVIAFLMFGAFFYAGQSSIAASCKRDGYVWIDGTRFACAPTSEPRA